MWTVGERPQYVGATTTLNRQVDAGKCRLRAYLAHSARTGAQGCGQRWWEAIPAGLLEGGVAPSHGVFRRPWGAIPWGLPVSVGHCPKGFTSACGTLSHGALTYPGLLSQTQNRQVIDACSSEVPRSQSPQRPHSSPTGGIGGSPSQGRRPTWLGIPGTATALPTSPLSRPI